MNSPVEVRFVNHFQVYASPEDKHVEEVERHAHAARVTHRRRRESSNTITTGTHSDPAVPVPSAGWHGGAGKLVSMALQKRGDEDANSNHAAASVHRRNNSPRPLRQRVTHRIGVAYKGNSDPFKSRAVIVSANINRVVAFIRDVALPSLYFTPYLQHCARGGPGNSTIMAKSCVISSRAAARDWKQTVANLDNQGAALACLAAFLCLLSKFTGSSASVHDSALSLKMRTKSSALLRDTLRQQDGTLSIQKPALLHMLWLFRAEAFAGNLDAALVHGKMLWTLIENDTALGAVDIGLLIHVLFVDVDLAVKFVTRPLFDVHFCTKRVQPLWRLARHFISPSLVANSTKVHKTVDFEPLREIMIADRVYRLLPEDPLPAEEVSDGSPGDIVFGFVASCTLIDNGRLLNYYLDLREAREKHTSTLSDGIMYTRAAMALALLYSIRAAGHVAWIQGVNIREASHIPIYHMHDMIIKATSHSTSQELQYYQHARLWILFLGTLFVQQQKMSRHMMAGIDKLPFTELLILECQKADVHTWPQMRAILTEFSYCDMLLIPHGSVWFERILYPGSRTNSSTTGTVLRQSNERQSSDLVFRGHSTTLDVP